MAPQPTEAHLQAGGFALAHALGSVEGGGPLCTLAFVECGNRHDLVRYPAKSIPASITGARRDLQERLKAGGHAALVYDAYATIDGTRHDAILTELITEDGTVLATFVQQYRLPRLGGPLGLLRALGLPLPGGLSVIGQPVAEGSLPDGAREAFNRGLADHPYGRKMYGLRRPSSDIRER